MPDSRGVGFIGEAASSFGRGYLRAKQMAMEKEYRDRREKFDRLDRRHAWLSEQFRNAPYDVDPTTGENQRDVIGRELADLNDEMDEVGKGPAKRKKKGGIGQTFARIFGIGGYEDGPAEQPEKRYRKAYDARQQSHQRATAGGGGIPQRPDMMGDTPPPPADVLGQMYVNPGAPSEEQYGRQGLPLGGPGGPGNGMLRQAGAPPTEDEYAQQGLPPGGPSGGAGEIAPTPAAPPRYSVENVGTYTGQNGATAPHFSFRPPAQGPQAKSPQQPRQNYQSYRDIESQQRKGLTGASGERPPEELVRARTDRVAPETFGKLMQGMDAYRTKKNLSGYDAAMADPEFASYMGLLQEYDLYTKENLVDDYLKRAFPEFRPGARQRTEEDQLADEVAKSVRTGGNDPASVALLERYYTNITKKAQAGHVSTPFDDVARPYIEAKRNQSLGKPFDQKAITIFEDYVNKTRTPATNISLSQPFPLTDPNTGKTMLSTFDRRTGKIISTGVEAGPQGRPRGMTKVLPATVYGGQEQIVYDPVLVQEQHQTGFLAPWSLLEIITNGGFASEAERETLRKYAITKGLMAAPSPQDELNSYKNRNAPPPTPGATESKKHRINP